nr:MAG TPA: hypothetical protein [Caudoviricetes sp.]
MKKVLKLLSLNRGMEEQEETEITEIHSMREIEGWENG